jgi:hypothetical protein
MLAYKKGGENNEKISRDQFVGGNGNGRC